MPLSVRRARADDAPTIVAFNAALAAETEDKTLDLDTLARGVAKVLGEEHRGFYLVAERDSGNGASAVIVGQCMITYEWSDWRDGWCWWLQSVYVAPTARRSGVFQALFEELRRVARERGDVRGLRLYVEKRNAAARATYLAQGMGEAPYDLLEVDGCP
jgi:GNAT superfamily N-acetyltransferase